MSKCVTCARIIACPRPETREVKLARVKAESVVLGAFIAERLDVGEEVPSGLYIEYILIGSASPYQLSRRLYAVFFRTVMTPAAYFPFVKLLKERTKDFPEQFKMLVHATLVGALQLYEWDFYNPHVKHFNNVAVGSGLKELSSGIDKMDEILMEQYPCTYINLQESVEALKSNPPKSVEEAKDLIDGLMEKSKKTGPSKMPFDVFANIPAVGGIN